MECNRFESYLKENEGAKIEIDAELTNHIGECRECKKYFLLVRILNSQKGVLKKAPETILFNVRQRINDLQKSGEIPAWQAVFGRLLKPAIAFTLLVIAVAVFISFRNSPIGVVDNLAERFNVPELKYINTGDVLYVGKNIHVDFLLKNSAKLQLDSNTLLQLKGKDKIALSRGQLYLTAGSGRLHIETPNGLITIKNTKTKIHTAIKEENGISVTKTSCVVFDGAAEISNSKGKVIAISGEEIVLKENGKIEFINTLTGPALKEQASRIDSPTKIRVFTAREQLCDCVYDKKYDSDHNQVHGKDIKENRFPVRIFWQNKLNIESRGDMNKTLCFFNVGNGDSGRTGNNPGI
jgi:hypothetical protein